MRRVPDDVQLGIGGGVHDGVEEVVVLETPRLEPLVLGQGDGAGRCTGLHLDVADAPVGIGGADVEAEIFGADVFRRPALPLLILHGRGHADPFDLLRPDGVFAGLRGGRANPDEAEETGHAHREAPLLDNGVLQLPERLLVGGLALLLVEDRQVHVFPLGLAVV